MNFTAESEGVTPDDIDRPTAGHHPHPRRRTDQRCAIPKDFCILRRSSGSRGSTCAPGTSSKGFSPACTAVRTSASRSSSCQHREYTCGDDLRHIDWKVWAKQDRYYVKQFEEDTNLRCTLLVDVSGSMRYGRGPLNKYEYGCTIAVSLAYLLLRQQDAVGCVAFDDAVAHDRAPAHQAEPPGLDHPGPGRQQARGTRPTCTRSCATWPRAIRGAGMMVLVSDLLVDRDGLFRGLKLLRQPRARRDGVPRAGRRRAGFPLQRADAVRGPGIARAACAATRGRCARATGRRWTRTWTKSAAAAPRHNVDYALLRTSQPLDAALAAFLSNRLGNATTLGTSHVPDGH